MMENNYFFKKLNLHQNAEQKERCACNYTIARNKELQFLQQKLYSERQNQNAK